MDTMVVFNPRPAGVASRIRITGGIFTPPPPVISGTKGLRGTREAAIESSRQDDSNQYLQSGVSVGRGLTIARSSFNENAHRGLPPRAISLLSVIELPDKDQRIALDVPNQTLCELTNLGQPLTCQVRSNLNSLVSRVSFSR